MSRRPLQTTGHDTALDDSALDGGLNTVFANLSDAEAVAVGADAFGVRGTVSRFATEKDDTFLLRTVPDDQYVLKVANPFEPRAEIDFQVDLLQHIERTDPTLPVPRVHPGLDGQRLVDFVDAAGQNRTARLMSYLDGMPLDRTVANAAERRQIGLILGRLRHATAGYQHPADTRTVAWDVKNLSRLRFLLEGIDDRFRRTQLEQGIQRVESLGHRIRSLRSQVLHNDFNRSNIVVDHAIPTFVTGIIDFGDAVRTAIAIDVSTALLNQLPRNAREVPVDDLFGDARDLLAGYLEVADLTSEELELIPHLVMARVVTRALLSLNLARKFPDNSVYLLRNTEQGWAQLDWFLARSMDDVSSTLQQASTSP